MRNRLWLLVLFVSVLLLFASCTALGPEEGAPGDDAEFRFMSSPTGEYIVVHEKSSPSEEEWERAKIFLERIEGTAIVKEFPQIGVAVVRTDNTLFAEKTKEISKKFGTFAFVGPDQIVTMDAPVAVRPIDEAFLSQAVDHNDLYMALQWDIKRVGGVPATWETQKGDGAIVAVLDTGVLPTHPDISPNYLWGKSFVIDHWHPVHGDVPGEDEIDYYGHGTHVASSIAAPITQGRIIGVAPEAGIANYKVLTRNGYGYQSWIMEGIMEAADDGCHVINMSLGGIRWLDDPGGVASYVAYARATEYAWFQGSLVVSSSGNDGVDLDWLRRIAGVYVPASTPGAMSINSTGPIDDFAVYSNYGFRDTIVVGPGGSYYDVPYSYCVGAYLGDSYIWMAGTSMAAPKVAGVAALIYAQNPGISPTQVIAILKNTADPVTPKFDKHYGYGIVNAYEAVNY